MSEAVLVGWSRVDSARPLYGVTTQYLTKLICDQVTRSATELLGDGVESIILTGSLARDEGTFVQSTDGWRLMGDAEFLVIFATGSRLPSDEWMLQLSKQIGLKLAEQDLQAVVFLSAAHPKYFKRLQPSIFSFELRYCGKVVWGRSDLLDAIPKFASSELALEDAWCLLSNRMIEFLAAVADSSSEAISHRLIKLYLDMAASLLVFWGAYEPTYMARCKRLQELVNSSVTPDAPVDLRTFCNRVKVCTAWKLQAKPNSFPDLGIADTSGKLSWKEVVREARALWRWELYRLTNGDSRWSDQDLIKECMRRQPLTRRLRGWAYVARKQRWCRDWRSWPSWARRATQASPRYWTYAAASELFFQLPRLLSTDEQQETYIDTDSTRITRSLPVIPAIPSGISEGWRFCALAIAWNYRQFLEGTRS